MRSPITAKSSSVSPRSGENRAPARAIVRGLEIDGNHATERRVHIGPHPQLLLHKTWIEVCIGVADDAPGRSLGGSFQPDLRSRPSMLHREQKQRAVVVLRQRNKR